MATKVDAPETYEIKTLEDLEAFAAIPSSELTDAHIRAYITSPFSLSQTKRAQESLAKLEAVIRELAAKTGMTEKEFGELFASEYLASSDE